MSFNNAAFNRTALHQIRDILKLPPQASHADVVAKVRELQFAAAVAGAALECRQQQLVTEHGTAHPR